MNLGLHGLLYTTKHEAARAFLRDKFAAYDSGGGWLIFDLPAADLGCHPSDRAHEVSFPRDDIDATVAEMTARGVVFNEGIREEEWGTRHFVRPIQRRPDPALPAEV